MLVQGRSNLLAIQVEGSKMSLLGENICVLCTGKQGTDRQRVGIMLKLSAVLCQEN